MAVYKSIIIITIIIIIIIITLSLPNDYQIINALWPVLHGDKRQICTNNLLRIICGS